MGPDALKSFEEYVEFVIMNEIHSGESQLLPSHLIDIVSSYLNKITRNTAKLCECSQCSNRPGHYIVVKPIWSYLLPLHSASQNAVDI